MSEHTVRRVDAADFDWSAQTGAAADVRLVLAAADATDGVVNLNEEAVLHLKNRGLTGAALHLADVDDRPAGFALLTGGSLDLVVAPDSRGQGIGDALATAALDGVTAEVEAWSHGDHPAAPRVAAHHGLERSRELWVMRRPLDAEVAEPQPTADYTVRTFRPGDEESLLEVNALAFAHHPEQGHLSMDDLHERMAEDWFDPEGLFLAVDADDDSRIVGFHWTKTHREADPPVGEVYVVAVDPRAAGRGIGSVLTAAGLAHLRDLGLDAVILYVEGDNEPAITVYDRAGFERERVEAQYRGVPS